MKKTIRCISGFSLIEILVLIVVIGIVASVALQWMSGSIDDIRRVKTEGEMGMLAKAITGDPTVFSQGRRSDFGYIGDIGAFPPNLQALYQNPGGYGTWNGPYLPPGFLQDSIGFKFDEWASAYGYSGGISISSAGGGSPITKKIADAPDDYLLNSFNGRIIDSSGTEPGSTYTDSVDIVITYPGGTGGIAAKIYRPDSAGLFTLDSIPVGQHELRIIYTPTVDTLYRYLTILPRNKSNQIYKFAAPYFTGGGPVSSSETLRPEGPGTSTQLANVNCAANWSCVSEIVPDEDGTYVSGIGGNWDFDLYTIEDYSVGSGTIDSVIVFIRAKGNSGGRKARTIVLTNSSSYQGSQNITTAGYIDYSMTYITNPATSLPWTWTEINSLEAGVDLKKTAVCTQLWVTVYYTN